METSFSTQPWSMNRWKNVLRDEVAKSVSQALSTLR